MERLDTPDSHHLSAALGWLDLGNCKEARTELTKIAELLRRHSDVLEVSWLICAAEKNWTEGLAAAQALVEVNPDRSFGWLHRAYALRRVPEGGLQAAWDSLLPVADKFPSEATIPYNLSCYACQMGRMDEARQWLRRAFQTGDKRTIKAMATADRDLEALWAEVKDW